MSNESTLSAETQSVVCPWCYSVTQADFNLSTSCKVCERQITEDDLEYEILKDE